MSYVTAHCPKCEWTINGLQIADVNAAYRQHYQRSHDDRTAYVKHLRYAPLMIEQDVYDQEDE